MRRVAILAALALAACGGSSDNVDAGHDAGSVIVQPTLSSIQQIVFRTGCAVSTCHDSGSHQGNLVMTDAATSFAHLVNQPAYEIAPKALPDGGFELAIPDGGLYRENICDGATDGGVPMLVAPGDPANSYLMWKLQGHDASGQAIEETHDCGQMPKVSGAALPADQIDAIKTWIANGAQND